MANDFLLDGIGQLGGGTNSGVEYHLLPPNQTSFSTNVTYRGAFAGPRPGFRRLSLDFGGSALLRQAATQNRWQGGCFYTADNSTASLVTSIGGKLFQWTPDANGAPAATVADISIPGDPNPDTPLQAWLWQAENYVIDNDGQSIPIFFDGTNSRRSLSVQQVYGITAANFTAPAIGATVVVTLTAPYTGPANAVVLIDDVLYQVTSGAGGYAADLTTLYLNAPITYPVGSQVVINPNVFGVEVLPVSLAVLAGNHPPNSFFILLGLSANFTGAVGDKTTILGKTYKVVSFSGTGVLVQNLEATTILVTDVIPGGTILMKLGSALPINVVGSLVAPFTPGAVGATVSAQLSALYSGAAGQQVFINNDQYTIAPVVPPPPGLNVTLINGNDPVGTIHNAPTDLLSVPELPPGRMGCYGLGQNWMSLTDGVSFIASDSVGSSSGTQANNYRDAVLRTVQTTSVGGLGSFRVPGTVGDIRAMAFVAMLDVSLGQGPLQIFTPNNIFSCRAPISPTILASITTPILTESLKGNGGDGQYDLAQANADIIFGGADNSIRSLTISSLDFDKWSNAPISREMQRIIDLNNKTLLQYGSSIVFNNRFIKSQLPSNGPLGVFHQGMAVLNFDPLSSIRGKEPSVWDGFWTGLNIFQMITGTVNGTIRCYAFCFNSFTTEIELWEILSDSTDNTSFDNGTTPITWSLESAGLFQNVKGKGQFDLCELLDAEIYLRDIRGIVNIQTWYRPDYSECWTPWHEFSICASNDALSDPKQYRTRLGLGEPDIKACEPTNNRPYRIGNTFQFRLQISGSCKFMGALFKARPSQETKFSTPICEPLCDTITTEGVCEPCKIQFPCLRFDPVFYNLNAGKSYANATLSFEVTCPDGSHRTVVVESGTIRFTLPFPVGYVGVYPPLVLGCVGGNIVRNVPSGATQEQIDAIVEEMIEVCAEATANATADCFPSAPVTFQMDCADGTTPVYTGTLPPWITIDTVNNRLIGAAGAYHSTSVALATAQAQAALNAFANTAITAGTLVCMAMSDLCTSGPGPLLNNIYQIQGYFDGMIINSDGAAAGEPVWGGVFGQAPVIDSGNIGWAVGDHNTFQMNGKLLCNGYLAFLGCVAGVAQWRITIGDINDGAAINWSGLKVGGITPEGVYTQDFGTSPVPATITIELGVGVSVPFVGQLPCAP